MALEQGGADIFGEAKKSEQESQTQILDDIRTAVQNPPAPPSPVGGATADNQATQIAEEVEGNDFLSWFKQAINSLRYPAWYDRSANAIRIQVQSGTITTLTTCTTVTGLTNIDGYQGKLLIINQNNDSWANNVRRRWTS